MRGEAFTHGTLARARPQPHAAIRTPTRTQDTATIMATAARSGRLRIALIITAVILVAEAVGGYLANSLALLADAGHMLTDVAALALSLFVAWFSQRPETDKRTYGYLRLEILAAFLNGATLLLISVWIIWEAVNRLRTPEPVQSGLMLGVAVLGLVANAISAWVLHRRRRRKHECARRVPAHPRRSARLRRHDRGRAAHSEVRVARGGPDRVDRS